MKNRGEEWRKRNYRRRKGTFWVQRWKVWTQNRTRSQKSKSESCQISDLSNKQTFDSTISPKEENTFSRASLSVDQASPPTKHRYSTSAMEIGKENWRL